MSQYFRRRANGNELVLTGNKVISYVQIKVALTFLKLEVLLF